MTTKGDASGRVPPRPPLPAAPIVFARRWDGLGGRLVAILNARAMAEALGIEFRFIWPRGGNHEIGDPAEVFNEGFLAAHQIEETDLAGRTICRFDPHRTPDAGDDSPAMNPTAALEVIECYAILSVAGEAASVAAARFRAGLDETVWSATTCKLIDAIRRDPENRDLSAVHIRAGDIVTGDWRHFMAYEKYVPLPYIEAAIVKLSEGGRKPVLILSDNEACTAYLRRRHRRARTSRDICPGYDTLGALHKALADILILSMCRTIVGPKSSAFSHLGANLGGGTLVGADRFAPEGDESRALSRWIEQRQRARAAWLHPFLARDICWFLDVFGETLRRRNRLALARRATALEPDFVAALARKARLNALSARPRQARTAARRAIRQAVSVTRHADPLFEALATRIAADCLALLDSPPPTTGGRLVRLRSLLDRCQKLAPFQMDRDGILRNLAYQVAALEWAAAPADAREADGPDEPPVPAPTAGLCAYRSEPGFDPVRRDLERVSIRISRAIARERKRKDVPREAVAAIDAFRVDLPKMLGYETPPRRVRSRSGRPGREGKRSKRVFR